MAPLSSPIFVDASAWIGASDRRDQHHVRARTLLEECFARQIRLVTTTWTAYEALSVLKSRAGSDAASGLWSLLTDRSLVTLIRVTEDFEARAIALFFAYGDKTWGSGIGWSETEETSAARFYGEGYDGALLERAKWLVRRFPALYQGCLPQSK